ncbi:MULTISPECIES: hypothetical protein [Bradyrhizobium]|uniref:Uncharacterized protein n=1 Tax=Bradyrhizobium elkanii TaxID=29448 RepID=A0A4U6S200_BRAEL|nr:MULTISPECIES: hypothetical protein [Bradyrhizobium]MTV15442.1 hypothetical protein [Bradyrhizobium sp. BR2003]TKV81170.1 hypothetical protein FDV58_13655 [Bradyrhizobium elkanii]
MNKALRRGSHFGPACDGNSDIGGVNRRKRQLERASQSFEGMSKAQCSEAIAHQEHSRTRIDPHQGRRPSLMQALFVLMYGLMANESIAAIRQAETWRRKR